MSAVEDLIQDRTLDFAGREWVFESVSSWANAGAASLFLISGWPGTGKTAIAARMVQALRGDFRVDSLRLEPAAATFFFHFCRANNDVSLDPLRFVERLSTQLAEQFPAFLNALASMGDRNVTVSATTNVNVATGSTVSAVSLSLNVVNFSARQAFDRLVRKPLEALKASGFEGYLLLLVDSLDEALTYGPDNVATLLAELVDPQQSMPVPLRLILTTRHDQRVLRLFRQPDLDLVKNAPDSLADVRAYVHNLFAKRAGARASLLAEKVATASRGNFLYARHVAADLLAERSDLSSVEIDSLELPEDVEDQYRRFLDRELRKDSTKWAERYQPIFGLLAVAQAPGLTADMIAGASELKRSIVDAALEVSFQYLEGPTPNGPFRIYHESFRDFLLGPEPYRVYPGEAHAALGRYLVEQNAASWLSADTYALQNAVTPHLAAAFSDPSTPKKQAAQLADLMAEQLTDIAFIDAHVERGWVFELVTTFVSASHLLPEGHPWRQVTRLLTELLRSEAHFIARHPQATFQALWNRGWWYDAPAAQSFYAASAVRSAAEPSAGNRLSLLLEGWRARRAQRAKPWLRALRPLPDALGSSQLAAFPSPSGDGSLAIGLSPDERRLLIASGENAASVVSYDLEQAGEQLSAIAFEAPAYLGAMAIGPRGDVVAVALGDGSLRLLDAVTLREKATLFVHVEPDASESSGSDNDDLVDALAFSPDGRLLVRGTWGGQISVWNMDAPESWRSIAEPGKKVTALAFSPDGRELAAGIEGDGGALLRWARDGDDFHPLNTREMEHWVTATAYAPNGEAIVCAVYSEDVIVLDRAGAERRRFRLAAGEHCEDVVFSADGRHILAGGGDVFGSADVYCWDLESGDLCWRLSGHNFLVEATVVTRDGTRLITGGDSTVRLWDLGQAFAGLVRHAREPDIDSVVISADGARVYTASKKSRVVRAREVATGRLAHAWDGHHGGVQSLALTPDGITLACGCGDGAVRIWNTSSGESRAVIMGHSTKVAALACSADGRWLATGAQDGKVRLIQLETQDRFELRHSRDGWLQVLEFSLDGRFLVSLDLGTARIWDLATRRRRRLEGDVTPCYSAAFTDDGSHVVLQGPGDVLRAWDVASGARVDLEERHRHAMNRRLLRNLQRWTWEGPETEPPELTLRTVGDGAAVAWLPLPYGGIVDHPSGQIWGVQRGGHFHLYQLEQA